jgi:hypothetical protein
MQLFARVTDPGRTGEPVELRFEPPCDEQRVLRAVLSRTNVADDLANVFFRRCGETIPHRRCFFLVWRCSP